MAATSLHPADIRDAFAQEMTALGGDLTDSVGDGPYLWLRGVIPWVEEVRRGDRLNGGVALRSDGDDVFVHPYVFRLVCTNGCIISNALQTHQITVSDHDTGEDAVEAVREAVRVAGAREVFAEVGGRMRTAQELSADQFLNLLPVLRRIQGAQAGRLLSRILRSFLDGGDRSKFGLLNAVTSVARDTADPRLRWRLEELGGGLLTESPNPCDPDEVAARSHAYA